MRQTPIAIVAAALFAVSVHAAIRPNTALDRAPPDPIYEVEPGERPGYLWTPGCWTWDGKRMVWEPGQWLKERPGYEWIPAGWEKRADKWYYVKGFWQENPGNEEVADPSDDEEEVAPAAPEPTAAVAPKKEKKAKATKARKPVRTRSPNYKDERIWPTINHH